MRHALFLILLLSVMLLACSKASEELPEPVIPDRDYDSFCEGDVSTVYGCVEYVKMDSGPVGSGPVWATDEGKMFRCPIVAPSEMGPECRKLLENPPNCELRKRCFAVWVPPDQREEQPTLPDGS